MPNKPFWKHNKGDSKMMAPVVTLHRLEEVAHRHQLQMNDIEIDILDFEGNLQPDDFLDWLETIERVFEYKEVPEEQKVKIVTTKLKKQASIWWENLKRTRKYEGKSEIKTWDNMCQKLTVASFFGRPSPFDQL